MDDIERTEQVTQELATTPPASPEVPMMAIPQTIQELHDLRLKLDTQLKDTLTRKRVALDSEYRAKSTELGILYEQEKVALATKYAEKLKALKASFTAKLADVEHMEESIGSNI